MSSTNRSSAREKHIADYYVTPSLPIQRFINQFIKDENICIDDNLEILDPCAGGDERSSMSYPQVLRNVFGNANITTNDIREDSLADYKYDFTDHSLGHIFPTPPRGFYDIVITNPPFNQAQSIIERSFDLIQEGGYVIMLLRLNYFGSKGREEFWRRYKPRATYIHTRRLSFTPDGKTDSIEYMHCVWRKGIEQRTSLYLIN